MLELAILIAATVDPCATAAELPTRFVDAQAWSQDPPIIQFKNHTEKQRARITTFSREDWAYLVDVVTPAVDAALEHGQCEDELERALSGAVSDHLDRLTRLVTDKANYPLALAYYAQELRLPADAIDDERRNFWHAHLLLAAKRYADAADGFARVLALDPHGENSAESALLRIASIESCCRVDNASRSRRTRRP